MTKKAMIRTVSIAIWLGFAAAADRSKAETTIEPVPGSPTAPAAGCGKRDHPSLWRALAEARYAAYPLEPSHAGMPQNFGVRLFANNPSQRFTARFMDDGGVVLASGNSGDSWRCRLQAGQGTPTKAGNARVEIRHHPSLKEWFENRGAGLEHGFVVESIEADADAEAIGLQIKFALRGDLSAEADPASTVGDLRFVNTSGDPVLGYRKLVVTGPDGDELEATMAAAQGGREVVISVAIDEDQRFPIVIDPLIAKFEAGLSPTISGDGGAFANFGGSVSIDGDLVAIGALGDAKVYIFARTDGAWSLEQRLSQAAENSVIGGSVSVDGDRLIVGGSGDNGAGLNDGAAYVYRREGAAWVQEARLLASDGSFQDGFGFSVSLDGDRALVGAPGYVDEQDRRVGRAYIFKRIGTDWVEEDILEASSFSAFDPGYGESVSLSGETACVGGAALGTDLKVLVYSRSGNRWLRSHEIDPPGDPIRFGSSLSLDGDTVAIFGFNADDDHKEAYIYERAGAAWQLQETIAFPERLPDAKVSVSLSADTVVFGFRGPGVVLAYRRSGGRWALESELGYAGTKPLDSFGNSDYFGEAVAISGDTVVIGAPDDTNEVDRAAGSAHLFERSGDSWTHSQMLDAGESGENVEFGISLGAGEHAALIGIGRDTTSAGEDAGTAYVFRRSGDTWSLEARLEPDDGAKDALFGSAVSLDGDTALIGAPGDPGTFGARNDRGAYIFRRDGGWIQQDKLEAVFPVEFYLLGRSVSLSGDDALVGAVDSAYLFRNVGGSWAEVEKLEIEGSTGFGSAVSIAGDTALVGAPGSTARAYVYARDGQAWTFEKTLTIGAGDSFEEFGVSVSVSGDSALVGSRGAAFAYNRLQGGNWSGPQKLRPEEITVGDRFGLAVEVSGNVALIGARKFNDTGGAVYFYERVGSAWSEALRLESPDGNGGFGSTVSLAGNTALVGVRWFEGMDLSGDPVPHQGKVFAYHYSDRTPIEAWRQRHFGSIQNSGPGADGADPNGNGLINFLDFAFGIDPLRPTAGLVVSDAGELVHRGAPVVLENPMRIRHLRRRDHLQAGLTFKVQFSSDLGEWSDALEPPIGVGGDADVAVLETPFPAQLENGHRPRFGRVEVTAD